MQQAPADLIGDVEAQLSTFFANGRVFVRQAARLVHPDLQPAGFYLLRILKACGPSRPSVLAEHLEVDRSAVSRLIQGLDEMGLIERTPDLADKRAHMLALTEEGTRRLELLRSDEGPLRRLLRDWDDEDIATLARLLARLNAQNASTAP